LQRNHTIDALRAFAVALVLGYHFFPAIFPGGYLGVDIFFVLSGYFIARAIQDGHGFSVRGYLARRFLRLSPALLLVLVSTLAAGWWILLPGEYIALARESLLGLGFATNLFPAGGDYFGPKIEEASLAHLWSLGVEMQVYLLAAFILPYLVRVARPLPIYVLLAVTSFLAVLMADAETDVFYNPAYRLWEFSLGALVIHLAPQAARLPVGLTAIAVGMLMIVPFYEHAGGFGAWVLAPTLAAAIVVHAASHTASSVPRAAVLLGQASYAIYLWHWPILVFWSVHNLGSVTMVEAAVLICSSIILGILTHLILERPILARPPSARAFKVISLGLFLLATAAFLIDASYGAPGRLSPQATAVLEDTQRSHPTLFACHSIYPGNIIEISEACRHNAGSEDVRTALWGDSHAAALAGGLIRAGVDFLELSYSGCPPLPGLFADIRGKDCLEHAEQSYDLIRNDPQINHVIIQARWPIYFDSATSGAADKTQYGVLRDRHGRAVPAHSAVQRLDEIVRQLRAAGKQVVLITPTPAFDWDLASAVARATWHDNKILPSLSRSAYEAYAASSRRYLEEISEKHGVDLIQSELIFCPTSSDSCPISDKQGRLITIDEDHLSSVGADRLSDAVLSALPALNAAN